MSQEIDLCDTEGEEAVGHHAPQQCKKEKKNATKLKEQFRLINKISKLTNNVQIPLYIATQSTI